MSTFNRPSNIPMSVKKLPPSSSSSSSSISSFASNIGMNSVRRLNNNNNNFNQFNSAHKNLFSQPSSIKSASRVPNYNGNNVNQGFHFNSVQKPSMNLFGMTPKTNQRSSYMNTPNNNIMSSARLSFRGTSSVSSARKSLSKDNRQLSSQNYHRELADKIVDFLNTNNYQPLLNRQTLLRLTLSDASRIFQYLLSYFNENIVIKNGPQTSLNIVVPKQMQLLGFPYMIKNSDLTSFSGGRQLGSVLSMLEYLVDTIHYTQNIDEDRLIGYDHVFWSEKKNENDDFNFNDDDTADTDKAFSRIHKLVSTIDWSLYNDVNDENNNNNDEFNNEKFKNFKAMAETIYGGEEEYEKLSNEIEELESTLKNIDNELIHFNELPAKKQALKDDLEDCEKYIGDMHIHIEENKIKMNDYNEKIQIKLKELAELKNKNKQLDKIVMEQKDLVIKYQYAIERRKQLQNDIEQSENDNDNLKKSISTLKSELKCEQTNLQSIVDDFYDLLHSFCNMYEDSSVFKFNQYNFINYFQSNNAEWLEFNDDLNRFKNFLNENIDDYLQLNELYEKLRTKMMKIFKDIRKNLIEQSTILKTKISLSIAYELQQKQMKCDQRKEQLKEIENNFHKIWEQKRLNDSEKQTELTKLNENIGELKSKCFEQEKSLTNENEQLNQLQKQLNDSNDKIIEKKYQIMADYQQKQFEYKQYEQKLFDECEKYMKYFEKQNDRLQKIIEKLEKF